MTSRFPGRPVDAAVAHASVAGVPAHDANSPRCWKRSEWRDALLDLPTAVIVNESFARRYFPGESAIGKRFFRIDGGATLVALEVIAVAKDAKYTDLREPVPPTVCDPYRPQNVAAIQVRRRLDMGALVATLRAEVPRAHAAFRLGDVTPQSTIVNNYRVRDRALAVLSAFFSLVAIVLVVVGLYGLLSYTVLQRTREIGIRLALGAAGANCGPGPVGVGELTLMVSSLEELVLPTPAAS